MTVLNIVVWPAGSISAQSRVESLWFLFYAFPKNNSRIPVLVGFTLEKIRSIHSLLPLEKILTLAKTTPDTKKYPSKVLRRNLLHEKITE